MKRRNFIKIFVGTVAGLATGVSLAKKKDPVIKGKVGTSMNELLAKMCSDGKYTVVVAATPEQIKQLKADKRSWREVSRVVFEQYAKERRGL